MSPQEKAFFTFVKEREQIRLRKLADLPFPWTEDQILRTYKFTNVHRHHDTTSRKLREMFYTPNFYDDPRTILMNAALYRYFGTWEFAKEIGWTDFENMTFPFWENVKSIAEHRLYNKQRVFTGAYVITNQGISAPKYEVVVDYFLKPLHKKVEELCGLLDLGSWKIVAQEMRKINGFGGSGFMTKEILLDTTYTSFWDTTTSIIKTPLDGNFTLPTDWWEWTPIGPGARRGATRIEGGDYQKPMKEIECSDVIKHLYNIQDMYWPKEWDKLCPHDVQFQLCEFDKYERVRLGQGRPRSKYKVSM